MLVGMTSIALLIVALSLRLMTFDRFLPVVDYSDELNMYMLALSWRGGELAQQYGADFVGDWLAHYPPLYPLLSVQVQAALDSGAGGAWIAPGGYVQTMRLIAVVLSGANILLVMSIGWGLGGRVTGWLAGLVWAITPVIFETETMAIPDGFVYFGAALSITLAVQAWKRDAPAYLFGSLIGGIIAIYAKYAPVYALIPCAAVTLFLLRRNPQRAFPWVLAMAVLGAAAAAYLVFGYGALGLENREARTFRNIGWELITNPARFFNILSYAVLPIAMPVLIAGLIAGVAGYWIARKRRVRTLPIGWAALLLLTMAAVVLVSTGISNLHEFPFGRIRHVLVGSMALIVMWSMAIAQAARVLRGHTARALVIGATLLIAVPALGESARLIARFNQTDNREHLWRWSDASLPPDGMILMEPESRLYDAWNRPWRGYDGATSFTWWLETDFLAQSPEQLAERGMAYFVMDDDDRQRIPALDEFAARLMPLKTIRDGVGSPIHIYRILPPEHQVEVVFGEQIALEGYDLDSANGRISFRPYWRALRLPDTNYSMFVHVYGDQALPVAQGDTAPAGENRLSLTWNDPDERLIGAQVTLDLPPGDYTLAIGLYDFSSGARLLTDDGADAYRIPVTLGT